MEETVTITYTLALEGVKAEEVQATIASTVAKETNLFTAMKAKTSSTQDQETMS